MSESTTQIDDQTQRTKTKSATRQAAHGRRLTRWVTAIAALGLVAAGIGAASIPSSSTDSPGIAEPSVGPRVLSVETTRLERVTFYRVAREYTGTIVARRVSELSFERAGLLEAIHVDEGTTVAQGSQLALLDTEHLQTRRRETRARRTQAAALLQEMVAGPRREDIDAARAHVESLDAQVDLLQLQTNRSEKLLQQNAVAQDGFDQFAFELKARQGQLNQAQHELEELLNGTRQEQIDAQRAIVEQLDAAIENVDVDLRKSDLKAPFAGTISRRLADEGTVVQTGQPILKLVEDSALEAWVGLPVAASTALAGGSAQRVRIAGRTFDAHVSGRRPEVDPATRTRTVILQLDPAATASVVHGQIVRLQLEETVIASGFWLPTAALTEGDRGLWACLVAVPDETPSSPQQRLFRVQRRDVEVLHTESQRVFVRGTLDSGDRVLTGGTHRVSAGQTVRILER